MMIKAIYKNIILCGLGLMLFSCANETSQSADELVLPIFVVSNGEMETTENYSASIRGRQDVNVLPQIAGRIVKLCVKEGERVNTGQALAIIDQAPYKATLRMATANVAAAQAKLQSARTELNGKQALLDEKVISDYDLLIARNQLAMAQAELEQMRAQEEDARNNLSYTIIKSPSDGVVGTLPYRVGAMVSPTMEKPFTEVSDDSAMYAYFAMTEKRLRQLLSQYGSVEKMLAAMPEVSLKLSNGEFYDHPGRIESVSGIVDQATGSVQIKAMFQNPSHLLMSGSMGDVVIRKTAENAIVIPKTATVELQDKTIAYILKNGKVKATYLSVEEYSDGKSLVVRDGLTVGDSIVAEGVGTLREGMAVKPKSAER